jgi:hypothetical protein
MTAFSSKTRPKSQQQRDWWPFSVTHTHATKLCCSYAIIQRIHEQHLTTSARLNTSTQHGCTTHRSWLARGAASEHQVKHIHYAGRPQGKTRPTQHSNSGWPKIGHTHTGSRSWVKPRRPYRMKIHPTTRQWDIIVSAL